MNYIDTISNFFLNPSITNLFNAFTKEKEECLNPFETIIKIKKIDSENFSVDFKIYDNVEKEVIAYQTLPLTRGIRTEDFYEDKVMMFTEAKISDRGERLIYSTSIHFQDMMLFHERMVIKIPDTI